MWVLRYMGLRVWWTSRNTIGWYHQWKHIYLGETYWWLIVDFLALRPLFTGVSLPLTVWLSEESCWYGCLACKSAFSEVSYWWTEQVKTWFQSPFVSTATDQWIFLNLWGPLGRRKWQPTPEFLPGEFHGQRSLAGYSPWGHKESDMTEWLTSLHFLGSQISFFTHLQVFKGAILSKRNKSYILWYLIPNYSSKEKWRNNPLLIVLGWANMFKFKMKDLTKSISPLCEFLSYCLLYLITWLANELKFTCEWSRCLANFNRITLGDRN